MKLQIDGVDICDLSSEVAEQIIKIVNNSHTSYLDKVELSLSRPDFINIPTENEHKVFRHIDSEVVADLRIVFRSSDYLGVHWR